MKTIFCFCSLMMGAICAKIGHPMSQTRWINPDREEDLVMSSGVNQQTTGDDANSSYFNTSDANSIYI